MGKGRDKHRKARKTRREQQLVERETQRKEAGRLHLEWFWGLSEQEQIEHIKRRWSNLSARGVQFGFAPTGRAVEWPDPTQPVTETQLVEAGADALSPKDVSDT